MSEDQLSEANVRRLLDSVSSRDPSVRDSTAAQLSKVAAKAEDDILLLLSASASDFVGWLKDPDLEPLVRAYTACILANIAFLEPGQQKVLDAGGVPPLVAMLKAKEDKKVTLHSTAAVQNLTYKNTQCCQEVLEEGGERLLKKLLQHKSEDVQQFAAGALANLQLYRRKATDEGGDGLQPIGSGKSSSMSKKVAKILRRKPAGGGPTYDSAAAAPGMYDSSSQPRPPTSARAAENAAMILQARFRGSKARREFDRRRREERKRGKKYDVFRVNDVRAELNVLPPLQESNLHRGGMGQNRKPTRLAPLGHVNQGGSPLSGQKLPGIANMDRPQGLPAMPQLPKAPLNWPSMQR